MLGDRSINQCQEGREVWSSKVPYDFWQVIVLPHYYYHIPNMATEFFLQNKMSEKRNLEILGSYIM